FVAGLLKFIVQPFGARVLGPSDLTTRLCALLIMEPGGPRDRLTPDLSHVDDDRGFARLEQAFMLVTSAEDIARRIRTAKIRNWKDAVAKGVITQSEGEQIAAAQAATALVIAVDDFAPEELSAG